MNNESLVTFALGVQEALTATNGFGKYGIIRESDMYRWSSFSLRLLCDRRSVKLVDPGQWRSVS